MDAAMVAVDLLPLIPGNLKIFKKLGKPASHLAEREIAQGMEHGLADTLAREIRSNPALTKQGDKIAQVLEELPRGFVKNKEQGEQLLHFISDLDKFHGGRLKPKEAAELLKSLDKKGLEGLGALVEDAGKILENGKRDASMTPQRALEQALKNRKGLSDETIRAVLSCATAIALSPN
jgi:hypothetical protein